MWTYGCSFIPSRQPPRSPAVKCACCGSGLGGGGFAHGQGNGSVGAGVDVGKARVATLAGRSAAYGLSFFYRYSACGANVRANAAAVAAFGIYRKKALQLGRLEAQPAA